MDFSENLKLQLSFSDMRVKELSEISGVKKSTIDSYLTNRVQMPSADAAIRLARALGVNVERLFGSFEENAGLKQLAGKSRKQGNQYYKAQKLAGEARELAKRMRDLAERLEEWG